MHPAKHFAVTVVLIGGAIAVYAGLVYAAQIRKQHEAVQPTAAATSTVETATTTPTTTPKAKAPMYVVPNEPEKIYIAVPPTQPSIEITNGVRNEGSGTVNVYNPPQQTQPAPAQSAPQQFEEPHDTFTGTVEGVTSRQYVRLPFMPKTFYVKVRKEAYDPEKHSEKEVVEGDSKYVYRIVDREELQRVFDYYDRYEYSGRGR